MFHTGYGEEQRQICSCGDIREQERTFANVSSVNNRFGTEVGTFAALIRGVGLQNGLKMC